MNSLSLCKERCPICKGIETDCFTEYYYPWKIRCKCRSCGHKWPTNGAEVVKKGSRVVLNE